MKISIEPHYDSDNSHPPDVEFEEGQHTLIIKLSGPEREIQIEYLDIVRVVNALCYEREDECEDE